MKNTGQDMINAICKRLEEPPSSTCDDYFAGYNAATARHEEEIEEWKSEFNRVDSEKDDLLLEIAKRDSMLYEIEGKYEALLNDAKDLYQYYLNAFRKTPDEYFAVENETLAKIKESRVN